MSTDLFTKTFTDANQKVVAYDGSPVTWRISAYVMITKDDHVLLIKNTHEELYDIVGGGIELGETIPEAVAREALEEAGAVVQMGKLVHVYEDFFYHRDGKYYQTLQLFYAAILNGELVSPKDQSVTFREFVPIAEVGTNYPVPPVVNQALLLL